MAKSYSKFVSTKVSAPTPVTRKIVGRPEMVPNSDGSFVFELDTWQQLDRFLILGATGSTYYANRDKLVTDNVEVIDKCIKADGKRVVQRVVEISVAGRAPRNDAALFVLALVASKGNKDAQLAAWKALTEVARIGTHLLHFVDYINDMRGWGRAPKKAVSNWFVSKKPENLAYQMLKYKQRDGWSMRDVLRTCHPRQFFNLNESQQTIFHWATKGWEGVGKLPHPDPALKQIWAAEYSKTVDSEKEIARLVSDYKLPWEAIDTKWLNSNVVWDAIMESIKPEALMRNLGRLTSNGYVAPMSKGLNKAISILTDQELVSGSRLHPYKLLVAMKTYARGAGLKGKLTWTPNQRIVDALEQAFYMSFGNVETSEARTLVALDVSASMTSSFCLDPEDSHLITPREASAAMAMITARAEPNHYFVGFTRALYELAISPSMRMDAILKILNSYPADYTNGGLPMEWAMKNKVPVDTFVLYTDSEMNAGSHPSQALEQYRQRMGIGAKLVCVGMASTSFTVADPKDRKQLDVVGFDTNSPQIICDFSASRI